MTIAELENLKVIIKKTQADNRSATASEPLPKTEFDALKGLLTNQLVSAICSGDAQLRQAASRVSDSFVGCSLQQQNMVLKIMSSAS